MTSEQERERERYLGTKELGSKLAAVHTVVGSECAREGERERKIEREGGSQVDFA